MSAFILCACVCPTLWNLCKSTTFILFYFFFGVCVPRCGTYANQQPLLFFGVCVPRRGTYANQQLLFFFGVCVPRCGTFANQQLLFFFGVCVPRHGTNANHQLLFFVSHTAVVKRHFLGNRGHGSDSGQLSPH